MSFLWVSGGVNRGSSGCIQARFRGAIKAIPVGFAGGGDGRLDAAVEAEEARSKELRYVVLPRRRVRLELAPGPPGSRRLAVEAVKARHGVLPEVPRPGRLFERPGLVRASRVEQGRHGLPRDQLVAPARAAVGACPAEHVRRHVAEAAVDGVGVRSARAVPRRRGGGDDAPQSQHLDAYEAHLANCLGYGVQACCRRPRLYDADATEALVCKWVQFFKAHRPILESDVIHLRRADGRGWDGVLYVNPRLEECGLAVIYNPSDHQLDAEIDLPLYCLTDRATITQECREPREYTVDRAYKVHLPVRIGSRGMTWLSVRRQP